MKRTNFLFLAAVCVCLSGNLWAQSKISKALPDNTWWVEGAFEEREYCVGSGEYHFYTDDEFKGSVLQQVDRGLLKMYRDPELKKEMARDEFKAEFIKGYNKEYNEAVSMEAIDADSLGDVVIENPWPGTAGVVEEFRVKGGNLRWTRKAMVIKWGLWDDMSTNFCVYFDANDPDIPWNGMDLKRRAGGYAEPDNAYVLGHHLFRMYPERIVKPGSQTWENVPYPCSQVFDAWNEALGKPWETVLEPTAKPPKEISFNQKVNYTVWVPLNLDPDFKVEGFTPESLEGFKNSEFMTEFVAEVMKKAMKGEVKTNTPGYPDLPLNILEQIQEEKDQWDNFDGNYDDFGEKADSKSLEEQLAEFDFTPFQDVMKISGRLERTGGEGNGGETHWIPERLILVQERGYYQYYDFAEIQLADSDLTFDGQPLQDFLTSDKYYRYLVNINDRAIRSIPEALYIDWFLWNDWSHIPTYVETNQLDKDGKLMDELKRLYGK